MLKRIINWFRKPRVKQEEETQKILVLTLNRIYKSDVTLGTLTNDIGTFKLFTLELPNKNNKKYVSCIPEGLYTCKHFDGFKYKDVWEVTGVKNRTVVLFHEGNTAKNTDGCILVGKKRGFLKGIDAVLSSKPALEEMKNFVGRYENGKLKTFMLHIKENEIN